VRADRRLVASWLHSALEAVDPEPLTFAALQGVTGPLHVIAIGKAAPAMCRGAAAAVGALSGLCITNHKEGLPNGVELVIGDHPVPGPNSLEAGEKALAHAPSADLVLLSGGGSALCEVPRDGVSLDYIATVTQALLDHGIDIEAANLVRAHLSKVKGGGLGAISTLVLSDVCGHEPGVVSSGPTIPLDPDPGRALLTIAEMGLEVPALVEEAIRRLEPTSNAPEVQVIGDGKTAARAIAAQASQHVERIAVLDRWITGPLEEAVTAFVETSPPGVTVAAGEPLLRIEGGGSGGRNTHAALLAATRLAGTNAVFAALATDGIDGSSDSAGAIVDGGTTQRGGNPTTALQSFDSATYLDRSGDILRTGPTGTNVADLWLIWKPDDDPEPILAS
jgi:glycerate 2-kinase